jgi:selenocysteine-specific elongation factor
VLGVSARSGAGLDELRATLVDIASRVTHRRHDGATRLPIDRAFSMQGFGTVVTGTLISGRVRADDELALVPGDRRVRVRGLQVHGRRREEAVTGQRTAVNLGGIEVGDIRRGQALVTPGALTTTRRADAVLELLPTAKPLKHGARVRFHQGTIEVLGRISVAGTTASAIQPGDRAFVRVRLETPAALMRGDRFILRAYSPTVTIAGGQILDPDPPRLGVRTSAADARFAALSAEPVGQEELADYTAIARMVADAGPAGLAIGSLTSRVGVAPSRTNEVVKQLERDKHVRIAGDRLVAPSIVANLSQRLLAVVTDFHKAQPLADGIPREEARERVFARADPAVFELVVNDLSGSNRLVVRERLSLPGHRLELSPEESRAREAVENAYKRAGLKPADTGTIAADAKLPAPLVDKMTALLVRQKVLVRVDTLIFHADALSSLKAEIQALKNNAASGRATVDVATFKDRYGVTRKFAIPLLEWLDRERVTRRVGESRIVL